MRGLVISAPASGQGKTTVTLGLLRALSRRGVDLRSAKSGPDYIDPAFHAAATGHPCVTLDAWAMAPEQLRTRAPGDGEMLIVEGAMGLFDGADTGTPAGAGATADVAAALGLPVILIVDAARMGQGAAAIVGGFARHRGDVRIAGVLFNRVGSARHGEMLRRAVEPVAPVLGLLPRRADLALPSRHLGLVQAGEHADLEALADRAAAWVAEHCDLDALIAAAAPLAEAGTLRPLPPLGQRIAVARDVAFGFAYAHMLADWRAAGAEILLFSPLADQAPDAAVDAVFLPGGYPELHAGTLAGAGTFRAGMGTAAARGVSIYGECGGYMVLGHGIEDAGGSRHRMLGLLDLETSFAAPVRHLGYRKLQALGDGPWPGMLHGHEFHYAKTVSAKGTPLFRTWDAKGDGLGDTGLRRGRIMGSFAHVIDRAPGSWRTDRSI